AVRRYQIPGGMLSNTQNQLNEMGMGDRFFDVMDEMPRVREDLGYPPLVTPTSQIVGTMAMMNVMMGDRYKMVPNEVKDLVRGKYGQLPGTISDEIRQTIIGDEQPITCRPADLIEPELEGYRQDLASKGYNG
ncbi:Conserved carboxylase region, partial [human gut metagenome]